RNIARLRRRRLLRCRAGAAGLPGRHRGIADAAAGAADGPAAQAADQQDAGPGGAGGSGSVPAVRDPGKATAPGRLRAVRGTDDRSPRTGIRTRAAAPAAATAVAATATAAAAGTTAATATAT